MITCDLEELPELKDRELRDWYNRPQARTLVQVAEGRQKSAAALAINEAMEASEGNRKLDGANANLAKAQRYQTFLDVWHEIITEKQRHKTAKLT